MRLVGATLVVILTVLGFLAFWPIAIGLLGPLLFWTAVAAACFIVTFVVLWIMQSSNLRAYNAKRKERFNRWRQQQP